MYCGNYREIIFLNTPYKILPDTILKRIALLENGTAYTKVNFRLEFQGKLDFMYYDIILFIIIRTLFITIITIGHYLRHNQDTIRTLLGRNLGYNLGHNQDIIILGFLYYDIPRIWSGKNYLLQILGLRINNINRNQPYMVMKELGIKEK